jgi:hypothetical protein
MRGRDAARTPPDRRAVLSAGLEPDVELFGQQSLGHTTHEQQAVYGALVVGKHHVARAGVNDATPLDTAVTVPAERGKQRKRFVSCSVPGDSSCHRKYLISVDR